MFKSLFLCVGLAASMNAWAQPEPECIHDDIIDEEIARAGADVLACLSCHFDVSDSTTSYLFAVNRVAAYPVAGPARLISKFGDPRGNRRHKGVDLGSRSNTPVVAAWDGKVVESTYHGRAGYYVKLIHPNGYATFYAHLHASPPVAKGQMVKAGQWLGGVGMSGNAKGTTPHLHFEIHSPSGQAVDPWPYLK